MYILPSQEIAYSPCLIDISLCILVLLRLFSTILFQVLTCNGGEDCMRNNLNS